MGAGKEQQEAPSLGVQLLSPQSVLRGDMQPLRGARRGALPALPPSAGLVQGRGSSRLLSPGSPQPGAVGVPKVTSVTAAGMGVLPSPSRLCWMMLWVALSRCFSRRAPGTGKETMRGREPYWSFSTSPSPWSVKGLPQMPQRGQVSASACPQEARPVPLAFTSVVFISMFSLSRCAAPRVWGCVCVLYKSN